jgi:hypothetical protein
LAAALNCCELFVARFAVRGDTEIDVKVLLAPVLEEVPRTPWHPVPVITTKKEKKAQLDQTK